MFKNYLKTTFRNFWKNKTSSAINMLGLTIGMTSCLLISLYISHELSYDKFELKGDRIARVIMGYKFDGGTDFKKGNFTSVRVAAVFKRNFPEVETAVKMFSTERVVAYNEKLFSEKGFMYSDPSFFDMFSIKLVQGDVKSVLSAPHQLVLTESSAKKYFGNEHGEYLNAVGQSLKVGNDSIPYKITGILQDCPSNSQIKFNFLASFSSMGLTAEYEKTYWDANYTTYLLLTSPNAIASLQAKLPAFMKKEMEGQGATVSFDLEPFTKIHLHSEYGGFEPNNSIAYIYILGAVALLILVIVCSTYINLSTARSMERAKEVGIRKVIGAGKKQLFWQFIGESVVLCLLSVMLSMLLAMLLLPWFNQLSEKELQVHSLFSLQFILISLSTVVSVSLLAGSYPALILTGFQPVKVLKGAFKNSEQAQWLRRSLIVFQFAISIFLIVSTFIIQKQLYYIQHKKLGYDREHVLVMPMDRQMLANLPVIKQQFRLSADVISVAGSNSTPVNIGGGYNMRSSSMPENQQMAVTADPVDEDYIKTTGLQIIAGTDLSGQDVKDVNIDDESKLKFHFILNESAAKELGWSAEEAIGKKMFLDASRPGYVKAVVKDFHFESLHSPIKPLVLFPLQWGRTILVKISGHNLPQTISFLASKWKVLAPQRPFEYRFMDEDYNKLYSAELRLGKIMNLFSGIAIVLACLGLFGLSSYAAQQRTKEIGVRKVLGASLFSLFTLLAKDFITLVIISFLIAAPAAYYFMHNWLMDYQYRTEITWWIFAVAGIGALVITLLTVSFQSIKTALTNPVKSLRTE
jgi:putative ABC transport system permease protein